MADDLLKPATDRMSAGIAALKGALAAEQAAARILTQAARAQAPEPARMQAQAQPLPQSLDRGAPRGTYLNILV